MSTAALRWPWPGSGLRGFLSWWRAGLLGWLPARLRRALAAGDDRLLLCPDAGELGLELQQAGELRRLASLPLPLAAAVDPLADLLRERAIGMPRWLLLPGACGLRRGLLLPAAARGRLRDVLAFEIERQTPFAATDVLFDGRVLALRGDGQLQVELVVVPRQQLAVATAGLGGQGERLAGVDLADEAGHPLGVNLLPPAQRYALRDPWRRWNWLLALAALLALALGMGQLLDNRRVAADALHAEMASREAGARALSAQRQRLQDGMEGAAYLRAQRAARPSSVELLDALAQRLPEGTWLEKVSVEGDQLTLIGLSNQAAALVGKLEGAPQWSAPALSGALQQDPRLRVDRFTLVAKLATAAAPAAANAPAGGVR
ncbi:MULTISPECIES: PilN domain-containing protein [Thermomonas]|uniref:PilN domain-containing protein n=1 Tax=Thermomonas TaxID=141948 RepID=UPI00040BDD3B|nr:MULTISPECIES: PilN domain-containing protein [Thermomonas]